MPHLQQGQRRRMIRDYFQMGTRTRSVSRPGSFTSRGQESDDIATSAAARQQQLRGGSPEMYKDVYHGRGRDDFPCESQYCVSS